MKTGVKIVLGLGAVGVALFFAQRLLPRRAARAPLSIPLPMAFHGIGNYVRSS